MRKLLKRRRDKAKRPPKANRPVFQEFEKYLRNECQLADNSILAYRHDLKRFQQWLGGRSIKQISIQKLGEYVAIVFGFQVIQPRFLKGSLPVVSI